MAISYERYREVPATRLPDDTLHAAYGLKSAVCRVLGLPQSLKVRWYSPMNAFEEGAASAGVLGWQTFHADERLAGRANELSWAVEVWIRADLPHRALLHTLAHELRHCHQFRTNYQSGQEWFVLARAEMERDANRFADDALDALKIA